MNRRAFIAAAPAVALAGAATAAPAETPVMALFRRHQRLTEAARASTVKDDDELDRLFYDELYAIEDEMDAIPAVTAQDMAAKMLVAHGYGDHILLKYDLASVWLEARALVA